MKLSVETGTASHRIRAYDVGQVTVNETVYREPLVVMPETLIHPWAAPTLTQLQVDDFAALRTYEREIILLGSGAHQILPDPRLIGALARLGIGLEIMDTAAACRTYNVLMAEDRRVAAALFMIESPTD